MPSVPITVKPSVVNSDSSRLRAANVSNAATLRRHQLAVAAVKPPGSSHGLRVLAEEHALDLADARRQAARRHDLHHRLVDVRLAGRPPLKRCK